VASDVEVAQFLGGVGAEGGRAACVDEGVAEWIHEVEESGGAMRIPPAGGERIEVRYFGGINGAGVGGG
jgi:hypothetical protein